MAGHGMERAAASAAQWGAEVNSSSLFIQLEAMPRIPQPVIVVVSAGNLAEESAHLMRAGISHLLIEKPAVLGPENTEQLTPLVGEMRCQA